MTFIHILFRFNFIVFKCLFKIVNNQLFLKTVCVAFRKRCFLRWHNINTIDSSIVVNRVIFRCPSPLEVQKTVRVPSLEFACLERRSNVFQLSRAHVRGCVEATPSSFEFKFLTRFRACRCANTVNFCRGENWCFIECCFEYSDIKDYRGIVDKERKWFGSENRPCLENERRATNAQRRVRRQGKFIYLFNVWQISIFQTLFA